MIFLQADPPVSPIPNLIFFASIFFIMYFFFFRPAKKRQQSQEEFTKDLAKGKEVVTTSGIIGRITKIEDGIVQLQIDQKTFVRVVQGAISKEMTENLKKKSSSDST